MDVRLSAEQRALRDSAIRLIDDLGPGAVGELADLERADELDAAVVAAGWRDLRGAGDDGAPWASAVEVALVAEEMGRGLADTALVGPTLAADLRRRAGAAAASDPETVLLTPDLGGLATTIDGGVAVDARGAHAALLLLDGHLASVRIAPVEVTTDLTRPVASPVGAPTALDGGALDQDDLQAWAALGLAVACGDLVGTMAGAVALAVAYARERVQYGRPIGSFQAVQHLLADAHVAVEGARSVALHAAWAVDALPPAEALSAASTAKAYCGRAARTVCETAIQVHGGIGNTWECAAHVHLRRVLLSTDLLGGVDAGIDRVLAHAGIGVAGTGTDEGRRRRSRPDQGGGRGSGGAVDFGDSPDEAEFRARLRAWLADNDPGLPTSSTSDEYWAGQAAWHRSLHRAGFFGLSWPRDIGGHDRPSVYDVILDEELAAAGAPPRPSLGYLVQGLLEHGDADIRARFLPGIVDGSERWCQGFSEPDAGSDLASLRTRAVANGDDFVITGHKVWTSYSDVADWCLLLARTDPDVPPHKGISAFVVPMQQPGIEQRPITMINGVTTEFGEVVFDGARVPAANMVGAPGEGWRVAMTVVSHEREPGELGYVARYAKLAQQMTATIRAADEAGAPVPTGTRRDLAWALVESEMLRTHVCRRLSDRLDGIAHGPEGSVDKLLMTQVEQTVGHAAMAIGADGRGAGHAPGTDATALRVYLYSRAQSVMGGTSQIQRNLVATRILGLPTS